MYVYISNVSRQNFSSRKLNRALVSHRKRHSLVSQEYGLKNHPMESKLSCIGYIEALKRLLTDLSIWGNSHSLLNFNIAGRGLCFGAEISLSNVLY